MGAVAPKLCWRRVGETNCGGTSVPSQTWLQRCASTLPILARLIRAVTSLVGLRSSCDRSAAREVIHGVDDALLLPRSSQSYLLPFVRQRYAPLVIAQF